MAKLLLKCACGHRMHVPEGSIGKAAKCTQCGATVKITEKNTTVLGNGSGGDEAVAKERAQAQKKRIGELLLDAGLINEHQLREALNVQQSKGGKLAEVLISLDYMDLPSFVDFLARQPGVASIDLLNYHIPQELLDLVPKEMAVQHEVFPIDKMGRLLTLGMACPLDSSAIADIESRTGLKVKALLCPANDIRAAITRYYGGEDGDDQDEHDVDHQVSDSLKVETGIKMRQVGDLVKKLDSLPALPETVLRIRQAMGDIDTSVRDVAELIGMDPPLAAKILSVANSAAYGFPNQVKDLDLAVALMGLKETYSIALSAAVIDLFDKRTKFDYGAFWADAMNCAKATRIVAEHAGKQKQGGYFSAGLLHDIGRIALLETVPNQYNRVSKKLAGLKLVEREENLVGLSHTEAGYVLAQNWNLPPEIAEPIRYHHTPYMAGQARDYVAVVAIADELSRCPADDETAQAEALEHLSDEFAELGIDESGATNVCVEVSAIDRAQEVWDEMLASRKEA